MNTLKQQVSQQEAELAKIKEQENNIQNMPKTC